MGVMDELINATAVNGLRQSLSTAGAGGPLSRLRAASREVDGLKLRARTDLVTAALLADLPGDYAAVAGIVRRALAADEFTGWMIWPVTEAVTTLALESTGPAAFEDGLLLLAQLTPRLTGEFAIRRFLAADLERSLEVIATWTENSDPAVRRLASEGTRAYLPWAVRVRALIESPKSTLPILDSLHGDDSDYVRRSVANHLNDLARHAPDLVVSLAQKWMANPDANTLWVVRHGLRTLIKKGDPAALALMGFRPASITVSPLHLDRKSVSTPGELGFEFEVTNDGADPVSLAVDFAVHYLKSNGSHSAKVFKLTSKTLAPGETIRLAKKHAFRPMTTRVHYSGEHIIELQINGKRHSPTSFQLIVPTDSKRRTEI